MGISKPRQADSDVARILGSLMHVPPQTTAPQLILSIGLPGNGKSTFCRRLAAKTGFVILESDALRRLLFHRPTHAPAESARLFPAIHEAARLLLLDGASVIIDATNLKESDRAPVYRLAHEAGVPLTLLYFTAPRDMVEARLKRRLAGADQQDNSSAGPEVYARMSRDLELPRRQYLTIDTSDRAAVETALRRVVEACKPEQQASRTVAAGANGMGGSNS